MSGNCSWICKREFTRLSITAALIHNILSYKTDLDFVFLPNNELSEILNRDDPPDYVFIAVAYDYKSDDIICCRADGSFVVINAYIVCDGYYVSRPQSFGIKPINYGCGIVFGEWEIASDIIIKSPKARVFTREIDS